MGGSDAMKDPPLVFDTSYRVRLASGEIVESGEPDPASNNRIHGEPWDP